MERQFLFFIFLGISQPILAWNEAVTVFFNLLNFFAIFLEFFLKRQGGTKRPILTWNEAPMLLFDFLTFLLFFFWIFYYPSGRNGTKRQFLFFIFLGISEPILAWNEIIMVFLYILNFFSIFFKFSITHCVETKRNDNFYFPSFSEFSFLFWLEMKP